MHNRIENGVTSSEVYDLKETTSTKGLNHTRILLNEKKKHEEKGRLPFFGYRHLVTLLGFFTLSFLNGQRIATSVAVVAMVNNTQGKVDILNNTLPQSCAYNISSSDSDSLTSKAMGVFNWDSTKQGTILAINFAGYMSTNIPAGRMAEIFGVKWTILCGNLATVFFTLISPISARWSPYALMMLQFLKGMSQGFTIPPAFVLMANWFPSNERSILSSIVLNGLCVGSMVSGLMSGWICDRLGWAYVFYIMGGVQGIFCIFFFFLYHEGPHCHPTISQEERNYIAQRQANDMSKKRPPVPWRKMFTSLPVCALLVGMFGYYWCLIHFLTVHPAFMRTILQYTMTENGLLSSLPFIIMVMGCTFAGIVSNKVKNCASIDTTRKTCNSVYTLGFCMSLAGVILSGCDRIFNAIFFYLASFFIGIGLCGCIIVNGDMTPTFAGSLSGVATTMSTLACVILPVIVGAMTKNGMVEEWNHVFYMHVSVVFLTGLFFLLFGSAEIQDWNLVEENAKEENITEKKANPSEETT